MKKGSLSRSKKGEKGKLLQIKKSIREIKRQVKVSGRIKGKQINKRKVISIKKASVRVKNNVPARVGGKKGSPSKKGLKDCA